MKIKSVQAYWVHIPLLHDLVEESFPVKNDMIEVPERAGLSITVREDFPQKHTVTT